MRVIERAASYGAIVERPVTLSVIIPTRNRREDLIETVRSITAQTRLPDELIIVDQSPADECREAIERILKDTPTIRLTYIWDPAITGLPAARNRGFDESSGDLICFLDDDTTPASDFMAELEKGFAGYPGWDGLSGRFTESKKTSRLRGLGVSLFRVGLFRDDRAKLGTLTSPRSVRLLTGAACCFRRRVFDRFRFDESLAGYALGEDLEFCLRAGRVFRFGAYPPARAHHRRSQTGRPSAAELRKMTRASAKYLWRTHRRHIGDDICYLWLRLGFAIERLVAFLSAPR